MNPKFSQYINKPVLVSIPALFPDGKARPFTLVGAELHGLWLQSDELAKRLLHADMATYATAGPVAFVPFAQIASVLFATRQPTSSPAPAAAPPAASTSNSKPMAKAPARKKSA